MKDQSDSEENLILEILELKKKNFVLQKTLNDFVVKNNHVETELKHIEIENTQLVENSNIIFYRFLLKPEFKFEYVSSSLFSITGYTPEEHYKEPLLGLKLIHPDDRELLDNSTKNNDGKPIELRWLRKDGQLIWTELRHTLLFDENNDPYAIEGNARDITDRKNIETGLRKVAERNSLLLDLYTKAGILTEKELFDRALEIAVKLTDSKIGFFHQVSENQNEIILTTWNEEAKKSCNTVFDNHYDLDKAGNWADSVRSKSPVVYNDYSSSPNKKGLPEGHAPVHKLLSIPVISDSKVRLIFGVGNKITDYTNSDVVHLQAIANELFKIMEKRKLEKILYKSEERFALVIKATEQGIWDWNVETGDVFYSEQWKNQIGYKNHELKNEFNTWIEHLHPEDKERCQNEVNNYLKEPTEHFIIEFRFRHKDGSYRWIHNKASSLKNKEGKIIRMFGIHTDFTEQKLAEMQLKESQIQYWNLSNSGVALLWTSGKDKLCNYFNDTWLRFTGRTLQQELGNGWTEGVHPDDLKKCIEIYSSAFDRHQPFEMEYRLQHNSGQYRWILDLGTPNFNSSGEFIGYIGHCIDITEHKQLDKDLKIALTKYKTLFNIFPLGITVSDLNGKITESNLMAEKLLGLSNEETQKRHINGEVWKIIRTDGTPMPVEEFASVKALRENCLVENVKMGLVKNASDITWINASAAPIPIENEGVVIVYSDISERKLIEDTQIFLLGCGLPGTGEDFFESLARYLSKTLNMGYVCIDQLEGDGQMAQTVAIYKEGRFENNIRYALKDTPCGKVVESNVCFYKQGVKNLFPNDPALQELNAESYVGTTLIDSKGKTIGLIAVIGDQILNNERKPEILLKLVAPRAAGEMERREAENDLKESLEKLHAALEKAEESDRLKTAFLANMSHEIRTPMNGILGFSELLKEPGLNSTQQQNYIKIIEKSGNRMLNIINNIVDISKIQAGLIKPEMQELNINDQIEYVCSLFNHEVKAKRMNINIIKPLPAADAMVFTDRDKLYSILTNLIKNAIKYSEKGTIEVGCVKREYFFTLFVKDEGIGIPREKQQAIFERFVQADIEDKEARQGAGLGLAITKSYVEMLGGKIWVESQEHNGSCFYFTIPCNIRPEVKPVIQKSEPAIKTENIKKLKILIADDDKVSEFLIYLTVKMFASEILKAQTGVETVEICRENPDLDLILMDIRMPDLDGYDATKNIRQFNKDVIIIAQTAYGLAGDKEKALGAGCNDYLVKPVNKIDLIALIYKYFNTENQ